MEGFYWMMEKTKYIPENGQLSNIANTKLLIISFTSTCIIHLFVKMLFI